MSRRSALQAEDRAVREAPEPLGHAPAHTDRYARYVLGLLFLVYVFNFIDRQILAILLQPIKQDLQASDTAMFILILIGLGLGPQLVGVMSDLLAARSGDQSLRYALVLAGVVNIGASLHFVLAGRTLQRDLRVGGEAT